MALGLEVFLLWRNEAYDYWTLDLPMPEPVGPHPSTSRPNTTGSTVIFKAGYLMRSASVSGNALYLSGDINSTTEIEVIAAPTTPTKLFFNRKELSITVSNSSSVKGIIQYNKGWIQGLEIASDYNNLLWLA